MPVDPAPGPQPEPRGPIDLEASFAQCLELFETRGSEVLERFLADHPAEAPALRERFQALQRLGLVGAAADDEAPPRAQLGEFTLVRKLGTGGMGVVWLARQESLGREVAVKVLPPAWAASPAARQRFQREAHAVARLRHPNIVQVLSSGVDQGAAWIAFELVPGEGLDELLARSARGPNAVPVARFLQWAHDIALALECAHQAGVVHRDVKPGNVRITPDGRALLLDFGLARDAEGPSLTLTGAFQGSPQYAAPEQVAADGGPVDARADVYALGITLYECLAGRPPFTGQTTGQLFLQVLTAEPRPLRQVAPHVPRDLATVVTKAIEKRPQLRYASARELAADLAAVLALEPIRAQPPSWPRRLQRWARRRKLLAALLATVAVALTTLLVVSVSQQQRAASERRREARAELALAGQRLDELRRLGGDLDQQELEVLYLSQSMIARPLTAAEYRTLDAIEDDVAAMRIRRERLQHEILDSLRRAQRLDGALTGVEAVEADLNHELWREAEHLWRNTLDRNAAARAEASAKFYRRRVEELDSDQRHRAAMLSRGELVTDPPGAETWWFRLRELREVVAGGEPRLVPVPVLRRGPAPAVTPGTLVLRVVRGAGALANLDLIVRLRGRAVDDSLFVLADHGALRRGDRLARAGDEAITCADDLARVEHEGRATRLVFEREGTEHVVERTPDQESGISLGGARELAEGGGLTATVCRAGELLELELAAGAELRPTAAPLVPCPGCALGPTPLAVAELEQGSYVVLLRHAGCRDQRVMIDVVAGEVEVQRIELYPETAAPPELVPVEYRDRRLLVMDREVTAAEYLAFLNDPATLAAIAASTEPIRFPRDPLSDRTGGFWPRAADGSYRLPDDWHPRWPILGVSWHDAAAYAAWQTARVRAAGYALDLSLPTLAEWEWFCSTRSYHVFGNRFRARWVSSCYCKSNPGPEPVQSRPVDESPHGLFDLSGSAFEWLDGWFWERDGQRPLSAGSWAMATPVDFRAGGTIGARPEATWNTYGFRLVAR